MDRSKMISQLEDPSEVFDFLVIGGGATGIGIALDASTRGYRVALFEQSDFTKELPAVVRSWSMAVSVIWRKEMSPWFWSFARTRPATPNAPHLVKDQTFLIPCYRWWEGPFYTIGLILYDVMAGKLGLGRSVCIGPKRALRTIPMLRPKGMTAGVLYHDGQFDDSRLAINMVRSSIDAGACILNYAKVIGLLKDGDRKVSGVTVRDEETGTVYQVRSRCGSMLPVSSPMRSCKWTSRVNARPFAPAKESIWYWIPLSCKVIAPL